VVRANISALADEAAGPGVLARPRPDLVPELAVVDLELGWMLMGDAGRAAAPRWAVALPEVVVLADGVGRRLTVTGRLAP
jgi:hypothetical protein